jgi:hypothetical protein
MSNAAQTLTIIGLTTALVGLIVGIQTFWIARALDRIERRLDRIDDTVLRDHGDRLARLEAAR